MRRHALSTGEAVRISRAVARGEELTGPRLRAAAVEWAEVLLRPVGPRTPRRKRLLNGLLVVYVVAVGSFLAHRLLTGHPEDVNWVGVVAWIGFAVWAVRRRRNLRRAMQRNATESPAAERP
jgi:hypothetical protein